MANSEAAALPLEQTQNHWQQTFKALGPVSTGSSEPQSLATREFQELTLEDALDGRYPRTPPSPFPSLRQRRARRTHHPPHLAWR